MKTSLKVGIWGFGSHARNRVLPALKVAQGVDVSAVLTSQDHPDVDSPVFRDLEAFLGSGIDVVVLTGPSGLHYEHALAAIASGCHVWSEKPVCTSLAEGSDLVALARGRDVKLLETDMFLHHPQWRLLRECLGSIGGIESMTARFGFPHIAEMNFRYDPALGGGALLDAGFYPIAAAVDLLGPSIAVNGSVIRRDGDLDIAGGAMVSDGPRWGFLEWGFGMGYRSEVEVWGSAGWVRAERAFAKPGDLSTEVSVRTSDGRIERREARAANHFQMMYEHFANVTLGMEPYEAEVVPILGRAAVMDAIRVSST
jgi:NDP-hexose-3-ketoreductase